MKQLQRVRFRKKDFTTCQIYNLKIIDVPDSDLKSLFVVKISTTIVYDVLDFELKKKSNGEIFGKGILQPVRFWFHFLKTSQASRNKCLYLVRIWSKFFVKAKF